MCRLKVQLYLGYGVTFAGITILIILFLFLYMRAFMMDQIGKSRLDVLMQISERSNTIKNSTITISNLYRYDENVRGYLNEKPEIVQNEPGAQYLDELKENYDKVFHDVGLAYDVVILGENGFRYSSMGNVEFGPKVRGIGKEERKRIADHYIDLVGLKGFEKSFPSQLSGGMRQRVGIARAYSNNPELMLMDEPFGHLDAQTRYMMEEELQRIWQKEKRTVVFVTNNIEEALFLADRIILMTNCPSVIKKEYVIDLPHKRSYVDPEFLRLRQEITENMDKSL